MLSTRDASLLLLIPQRTIERMVDDGRIPGTKTKGGHRRIRRADVDAILDGGGTVEANGSELAGLKL